MAYTINRTDNTVLTTVTDGTIESTKASLVFIGKNYTGYGEILNENFAWLLENFAHNVAPPTPMTGQIWWNTGTNVLNVFDGTDWKSVSSSTVDNTEPGNSVEGDLWWNSDTEQLSVYNGTNWVLVGPSYSAGTGQSGTIVDVISDDTATSHVVVYTYVNNKLISITSGLDENGSSAPYTPVPAIPGFPTIYPGVTLVDESEVNGVRFTGTATNAELLDNIDSSKFLRSDIDDSTVGILHIDNDGGITVGGSADIRIEVISGSDARIRNSTSGGKMDIAATKTDGTMQTVFSYNPSAAADVVSINGLHLRNLPPPTNGSDAATKDYVDNNVGAGVLLADGSVTMKGTFTPDITLTYDLGSPTKRFTNVYADNFSGTANTAKYADLAEMFIADKEYPVGTVVKIGGDKEITAVDEANFADVLGVISTNPAYLMNANGVEAEQPVALIGRVPVRMIGKIKKGDRVASGANGVATKAMPIGPAANIIGYALEDKDTDGEGLVEVFVRVK